CARGGSVVITRNRVPPPAAGLGKFATLMARTCGRDTESAAFEYYIPTHRGDGLARDAARSRPGRGRHPGPPGSTAPASRNHRRSPRAAMWRWSVTWVTW
ncbi:MAG TPA: hypothetical protein VGJ54_04810, partial [Streptosporangiaceae bacterium]